MPRSRIASSRQRGSRGLGEQNVEQPAGERRKVCRVRPYQFVVRHQYLAIDAFKDAPNVAWRNLLAVVAGGKADELEPRLLERVLHVRYFQRRQADQELGAHRTSGRHRQWHYLGRELGTAMLR